MINNLEVSIILGAFEFAGILTAFFHPFIIKKLGKKTCIVICYITLTVCPIFLALLYRCDPKGTYQNPESTPNYKIFYAISFIVRFIQGTADALLITCILSTISQAYQDNKLLYLGYCETSIAAGLMIGPSIGSALYGSVGYEANFYIISAIFFLTLISIIVLFPKKIIIQEEESKNDNETDPTKLLGNNINFKNILCNYKVYMCYFSFFYTLFCLSSFCNYLPI